MQSGTLQVHRGFLDPASYFPNDLLTSACWIDCKLRNYQLLGANSTTQCQQILERPVLLRQASMTDKLLDGEYPYKLGGASRPLARSARSPELATLATITCLYLLKSARARHTLGTCSVHALPTLGPLPYAPTATLGPRRHALPTLSPRSYARPARYTLGPRSCRTAHTRPTRCPHLATALPTLGHRSVPTLGTRSAAPHAGQS